VCSIHYIPNPFSGSNERLRDLGKVAYTLEETEAGGLLQIKGQSGLQTVSKNSKASGKGREEGEEEQQQQQQQQQSHADLNKQMTI
jgi:formylmethanofuran dehydrogenase subunit E